MVRARLHEMSDEAPQTLLPPLGEHRPTRAENVPTESGEAATPLLLRPEDQASGAAADAADGPLAAVPPLAPADPEAAPPVAARHSARHTSSMLAAVGAHLFVLGALISAPLPEYGGGGSGQEAISVSIISASALDARDPNANVNAKSAVAPMAPQQGDDVADTVAEREQSRRPEEIKERATEKDAVPDEQVAAPAQPAPEAVPDEAPRLTSPPPPPEETKVASAEPPPEPDTPKKEENPAEKKTSQQAPDTRTEGGEVSSGHDSENSRQAAAANAAQGKRLAYGLAVQDALLAVDQRDAKAIVSASKLKGTVFIKLVLDAKGTLASAEIFKSSGNRRLDEVALLLTRRATYPPPPPGIDTADLSYIAPVRFR
ncbi:energy transducer TonB [Hyphomicrobium sp. CS1BSMeth3]|uniref:energy transducer TonB n=1 Tax=Hyphomicrobium sp. CS1BSMeth3 TaxID=1892844 RepID=UPI001575EDCD|nr:energy transducer TonB [Hyphomicrobium sp. CS1BSMeth3]